jgi:hypothetical protein
MALLICANVVPNSLIISTLMMEANKDRFILNLMLFYDRRSVGQSVSVSSTHLVLMPRFQLPSSICGFLLAGRPLWREDGSVIHPYNCYWVLPALSLSGPSLTGLVTTSDCPIWDEIGFLQIIRAAMITDSLRTDLTENTASHNSSVSWVRDCCYANVECSVTKRSRGCLFWSSHSRFQCSWHNSLEFGDPL